MESKLIEFNYIKFLGVIIDDKLSWTSHIQYICSKISKGIGIIAKARKYVNNRSLITLYYSFIYPYILYCIEVWGRATENCMKPLYILQKKIVRMIDSAPFSSNSLPIFKKFNILTVGQVYHYRVGLLMYKILHQMVPSFCVDMFVTNSNFHNYSTRHANFLRVPKYSKTSTQRSIKVSGIQIWNNIKLSIDTDIKISQFKKLLQNYVIT